MLPLAIWAKWYHCCQSTRNMKHTAATWQSMWPDWSFSISHIKLWNICLTIRSAEASKRIIIIYNHVQFKAHATLTRFTVMVTCPCSNRGKRKLPANVWRGMYIKWMAEALSQQLDIPVMIPLKMVYTFSNLKHQTVEHSILASCLFVFFVCVFFLNIKYVIFFYIHIKYV